MSYPKTPVLRAPKPSQAPVWRYSVKKKPNGNWGIVATHKADPEIQWATGFAGSSQGRIFSLALALTAGRSDPSRFAWQPAAEVWP